MIGELITAGAGLLGSIFGGKKKQKVETTIDYRKMAASAAAAGFNPLTAIRNGGSAGFTTTTSPTVSQMPEALANLGGVLGGALEKKLDPIEAKRREPDTALVNAQLSGRVAAKQVPGGFYAPRTFTGTKVSQQLVPRLGATSHKQAASVPANYTPWNKKLTAGDPPEASDLGLDNGRYGLFNPGALPNAGGVVSEVAGEPGEWLGGGAKLAEIGGYSLYRNVRSAWEDGTRMFREARKREKDRAVTTYEPSRRLGGWAKRRVQRPAVSGGGGW